ncbi:hypothetical protein [Nocardia sp. NPDC005745]|uniref:hypothetical protein n=1 Tax=Nocardia sp. NPDC005745 TaxID=3157061 RepID=UPI0033CE0C4B
MAARVFADEESAGLREFPEISRVELYRFFELTGSDSAFREYSSTNMSNAIRVRIRERSAS